MKANPLRTSVVGSYPFPGWLEFAAAHLDEFGPDDIAEAQRDAVICAVKDQLDAGLDVITDGEQTRLDFNLSFYGYIKGIDLEPKPPRRFGPPAHDQRGKHPIISDLIAPRGLGVVEEFKRLVDVAGPSPRATLKASVPGPYTLSGRLLANAQYSDRWAITEALVPIVRKELADLVSAGCREICVDEPSMSCYAHKEDTRRFVDIFNRTIEPVVGKTRLCTHFCFGNYKARAVGPRTLAPMFPAFLDIKVDEAHVEMASREFAELDVIGPMSKRYDVAVGVIDVKSYYIETPADVADRVKRCLQFAPADRLVFAPDCGLSQTARWAAKRKLVAMCAGWRKYGKGSSEQMIEPLLSDDALLADIDSVPRAAGRMDLWWLGQSGYLLQHERRRILIDPYLSDSLTRKYANTEKPHVRMSRRVIDPSRLRDISIITSSHGHTDHLDAETLVRSARAIESPLKPVLRYSEEPDRASKTSRHRRMVIPRCPDSSHLAHIQKLAQERWGGSVDLLMDTFDTWGRVGYAIRAVPAAHPNLDRDDSGHHLYLGYIIRVGSFRIYHSGDTMVFPGMEQMLIEHARGQIDLAILPINGKVGNMTGTDAARLASTIGAKLVTPCHYDLFEFNTAEPAEQFIPECRRLRQAYRVLRLGERLTLKREDAE